MNALKLKISLFSFLALLAACGAEPTEISVTLTPSALQLSVLQSVQFSVRVNNSSNSAVTWGLSGAGCSGAACGAISNTGLYTAPASVPSPATVTVRATSAANTSKSASATITILAEPSTWTWVSGSNSIFDRGGSYGTRGLAAPSNVPGARAGAVSWLGSNGELWLFGGYGYYSFVDTGCLNDLWKFDPATLQWTWVSGSSSGNEPGIYGTIGVAHFANVPGARKGAVSWTSSQGGFWLFGGEGYDSVGQGGDLDDLWRFIR